MRFLLETMSATLAVRNFQQSAIHNAAVNTH